jgi:hypothetical protein
MQIRKYILKEAAHDLRFLLNRGYRKKGALNFVSNKYLLSADERNYMVRCVFSDSKSIFRRNKIVDISQIEGRSILIDGYNVLITVETIFQEDYSSIILCDDGIIRDLNAVFGKYKFNQKTKDVLTDIVSLIKKYGPSEIKFFFDRQVSFSGKLANLTEEITGFQGLKGEAILSKIVDFEIIKLSRAKKGIVATSDGAIIDKVDRIVDLPFHFLEKSKISVKKAFSLKTEII